MYPALAPGFGPGPAPDRGPYVFHLGSSDPRDNTAHRFFRGISKIDLVTYITAHEVAHQWWGHQVSGGDVQGASMIVESMAQYSALMVMKQKFGAEAEIYRQQEERLKHGNRTTGSLAGREGALDAVRVRTVEQLVEVVLLDVGVDLDVAEPT